MVSTRRKRQSNKRLLSQLDDFDQDMIIGSTASERQENVVVDESTNVQDFTVGTSNVSPVINKNAMNVKTLERCFNERIDREMNNIVDTVEDRIQNAILAAIDNIVAPKIELAIRSINAFSGRDVTSVSANSECREHAGIGASFENASENNNTIGVTNINDEARRNSQDVVSELSVSGTQFDRQSHIHHVMTGGSEQMHNPHHKMKKPSNETHQMVTGAKEYIHNHHDMVARGSEEFRNGHHMVTGQTAQTNPFPEFLTGRTITPRESPLHQYQNLSTQVSQDNNLPVVEQTPTNQNLEANNSINRLVDAMAGITTQQRPQAATMLKPVSTNTLIFDGNNEKFELFEDLFHTMLKMQPEMTEAMKINHFHAHLRKEALQTFRNISSVNRKTLDDVLFLFRRKYVKPESQATAKHKWHKLTFDPNTKSLPDFLEELKECAERAFGDNSQDGVSELSVPGTQFDRQSHIHHVMTGGSEQIHNPHHKMKEPSNETHHNDQNTILPNLSFIFFFIFL